MAGTASFLPSSSNGRRTLKFQRADSLLVLAMAGPLGLWALVRLGVLPDPSLVLPVSHFVIGTVVSCLAVLLAGVLVLAASQLTDGRVLFIGLAFLCLSGMFLVHALTTPGILVQAVTPWVTLSSQLSLTSAAVLLGLSVGPGQSRLHRWLVRRRGWAIGGVIGGLSLYGIAALASALSIGQAPAGMATLHDHTAMPMYASGSVESTDAMPLRNLNTLAGMLVQSPLGPVIGLVTLGLLLTASVRYVRRYGQQRGVLLWCMAAATCWLTGAQLALQFSPVWHLSWWSYHLMLLAALAAAVIGVNRAYEQQGSLGAVVAGMLVHGAVERLERAYTEVIAALCATVEAKDPYTQGHSARVAWLAARIAAELGLPPQEISRLYQAGLLHDIGKIGIPDAVLQKPGRLTPEEFALIREHPVRGAAILQHVRSLAPLLPAVRWHHERLDGSGYPDGLVGEDIPLDARIMAVADVFDALTSARPYRAAMSLEEAFAVLLSEAGTKLDPDCVAALRRVVAHYGWPLAVELPSVVALHA